jgi:hypothetical protein
MAIIHRRNLARTTATAALVGSVLLLPSAAAFAADGPPSYPADTKPAPSVPEKPGSGAPSYPGGDKPAPSVPDKPAPGAPSYPADKPTNPAETLKITKKDVAKGSITYTLSSGDKAELSWTKDGSPSAKLTGGGAEGHLGFPAPGERELVSKTGVKFFLAIPATGKSQPTVIASKGKAKIELAFPAEPESGKGDKTTTGNKGKVVPKGGVKAGAVGVQQDGDTMLLASGGGAAAAAAGLGFAMIRRSKANSRP